ncbi:MAG: hypothetical protein M3134_11900 [Actinomycetota bacterium]|nr:hypothetical protein [Actinomycetota bacterium]
MTRLATITTDAAGSARWRSDAVSVDVLVLPEPCYRCGTITRSIVGFLIPPDLTEHPDGFVDFEVLAPLLVQAVTAAQLARWGVGPLKIRRSRYRPEGYLSNGCISCDAIQGSFPLHEDLMEFLSEGGRFEELIIGRWGVRRADVQRVTTC